MRAQQTLRLTMAVAGLLLAACGGGSDSSTATTDTSAADTTVPATAPATTEATTTAPSTAPPTTLPPTIDLSTLPGLLAVQATSCAPEPYPPQDIVEDFIICTLKPDGTDVKIVSLPGEDPFGLAFTRDGTHLWYDTPSISRFGALINLTTGEHREGERNSPLRSNVSPDGQLVLYTDAYTYTFVIGKSDGSVFPDGSTYLPVGDDSHVRNWGFATWAPDSVRFAYLSTNDGNDGDLECAEVWVGAIDGTPPEKITDFASNPDGAEGCPADVRWSPIDDRILVHTVGKPSFVVENLYVINSDGSELTALTSGVPDPDPNLAAYAAVGSAYAGDWSPDGKYIVFIEGDGTDYHLAVMNSDGSQKTVITAVPLGITSSLAFIRWSLG